MLSYNNLSLQFHSRWVFQNLSGSFKEREFVGIMGPNGSGKSSYLKCLAGLLKPNLGSIYWDGKILESYSIEDLSRIRAYGAGDMNCIWDLKVEDLLQMSKKHSLQKIEEILTRVKAPFLLGKKFSHLSSGEKSLVSLSLILLQETPFIMLDEITASLDEFYAHHVMELLCQETEKGKTVITILHDKQLAERYCHRVILF
ncbi:MAG: ABC transporter ATP-binding protein [Alphaproteobacteria bacterium]|nr:ABC transporter ATP-binding protein [Alphaproteobacteria bacterium]